MYYLSLRIKFSLQKTHLSRPSGMGFGTTNDLDLNVFVLEPKPNFPLIEDALMLCLRNFCIISLQKKK